MTCIQDMLPLNPREFLILFSLIDQERHGYGIVKDVQLQSEGGIRLDPSNLYRCVRRLIQSGLVRESSRRPTGRNNGERRRYYAISDLGQKIVAAEAARLARLTDRARARRLIPG